MGGNGSYSRGDANTEEGRKYKCIAVLDDNIKVLVQKNAKLGVKLPEESHSPNRIYVSLHGRGEKAGLLKAIAVYDGNGLKRYEIHTTDHDELGIHCHYWTEGHPIRKENGRADAKPLTDEMIQLYNKVLSLL